MNFPKKSENALNFPKKSENGLNFFKKSENGLNFPKKSEKGSKFPQKFRIDEDDMPVPAKLFTDSFAKHFLNLLLKHIRLISVVQMIARMFVVIKVYVSIPNP